MKLILWVFAACLLLSVSQGALADAVSDEPIPNAEDNKVPQIASDHPPSSHIPFGLLVQGYYDPSSVYYKMATSTAVNDFGSTTGTGMGGMQVLVTYLTQMHFELAAGFDYVFPVNVQGQQSFTGRFAVNSQTLNVMGIKVLQVGYILGFGGFSIVPYASIGIDYGKDVVNLTTNSNQSDLIEFTKVFATYTIGVRGEYGFSSSPAFSVGLAAEGFQPQNLSTQLSQSGSQSSELPGFEPNLQSGMDFMTGFGFRVLGHVRATF